MKKDKNLANNGLPGEAKATKTTLQKQGIFICVISALVALFLIFYFAILPLLQNTVASVTYTYEGEYYDGTTLYIINPIYRASIKKITVKNDEGFYVLNEKGSGSGKTFTLESAPETVLDEYSISGVVVAAGQPIAAPADSKTYRAHEKATEKDLATYGLDAASDPNWYEILCTDGTKYKIYLGNKVPTGSGCYAYVEGEDRMNTYTDENGVEQKGYIVYALDSTTYQALSYGKTALVNTNIGAPMGNGAYYAEKFEIYEYDAEEGRNIKINIVKNDESGVGASNFKMVFPGGYNINSEVFEQDVLSSLVSFAAESVVALGDEIYTKEIYEKYGLDLDREKLENGTDTNHVKFYIKAIDTSSNNVEVTIYVSKVQLLEDGTSCYYAYVPAQHEIVKLSADTYKWLSWDFGEYVNLRMFFEYIDCLDYFTVLSAKDDLDVRFTLTGNAYTYHVAVTDSTGKTTLKDLATGEDMVFDVEWDPSDVNEEFKGSFENFRSLYYVLITRMLDGSEEPRKVEEGAESVLSVTVQSISRDRNLQYYLYDDNGNYLRDENGKAQVVTYQGGYVTVKNLKGKTNDGYTVTYKEAFYDPEAGKYFVKVADTADGNDKPRSFKIVDGIVVPTYLSLTDITAEYTVVNYDYKFYDLYDEVTDASGNVTKKLNQTYKLIVPTTTTSVYRIEADGSETLVSEEVSENDNMGFYIRSATVDKLVSDTGKALAGIEIDAWGVN